MSSAAAAPRRVRLVFLGCGLATRMHSRTLRRLGDVDLFYASRDANRAAEYCRRFGGRRAFASYDAALADPDVDVALVATPTSSHLELTLGALAAGKHVIVEKPAFMQSADADGAEEAARSAGRRVLVAENYFYKPVATLIRRLVRGGQLGGVRFVTLNATKLQRANDWRADPAMSGGGALFEGGVHWISFASNIGLDVVEIGAFRVDDHTGSDRSSLVVIRYANGAVGTLAHSWELRAPFGGLRLSKVQGTDGAVTFESNGMLAVVTGRRRMIRIPALSDPLGYRGMFADFLHTLRTGEAPQFTLAMARRDLLLLEEAMRSMRSQSGATPDAAEVAAVGASTAARTER